MALSQSQIQWGRQFCAIKALERGLVLSSLPSASGHVEVREGGRLEKKKEKELCLLERWENFVAQTLPSFQSPKDFFHFSANWCL